MKVPVKNLANDVVKEIDLPEEVFGAPYKEHLIHTVVEALRAARRAGTHNTKQRRGEVRGSTRKPWRQKGTGRARAGSVRSPLWQGGSVTHGPKPRSYEKRVSAGEKKSALRSALAQKLREDGILVLEDLELETHKTAALAESLAELGLDDEKTLIVERRGNDNLELAARNNPQVKTVDALAVNVYDVIDRRVVFTEEALDRLLEVL
ncbi:MAG: 50S ribosomal protein L4 [Thermoanaerobaculia bacterium]|nr:50S ribosomal protein L4 [Thermoanaerobaculia bacterium]